MPTIVFYLDFVSPYAYIAFHRLPQVLAGLAWHVQYRPVVLGGIFKAQGNTSPASIPAKHAWILRHVQWLAAQDAVPLVMPPAHPFGPLPWLRMALAASPHGQPARAVCEEIFNALWQQGRDANEPDFQQAVWQTMTALLPAVRDPHSPEVKRELLALGEAAVQHGVFGVPSFVLLPEDAAGQPQLFWGVDSLPMLREAVAARQLGGLAPGAAV